MSTPPRPVLVVDFGAQYAQLIARRVREAKVYSEIVPHSMPVAEMLAKDPAAIILSGGPSSVYEPGAPQVDAKLFDAGVPVFGICYGFQAMAQALGGTVAHTGQREFGGTTLAARPDAGVMLRDLPAELSVWMSHGDCVTEAPAGFAVTAGSPGAPVAAFEDLAGRRAGVQFHPEVAHTAHGQAMLARFLYDIAGIEPTWTMGNIIDDQVAAIREAVGDKEVICGLSGGVDSAVAAALVHKAVGDQLTCVFVDHGLLRAGEAEQVEQDYVAATGIKLKVVDAADRFLTALDGVTDPESKRKIIGREFIRVFEAAAREVAAAGDVEFLVQGTLYPDVVESGAAPVPPTSSRITTWVACRTTLSFRWSSRCGRFSRMRFGSWDSRSGCPRRWCGGTRSRAGAGDSDHRRRLGRSACRAARRGPDRPRGAHRGGARSRCLAASGRPARRRAVGRGAGRWPDVRPPGRPAPGLQRRRDDGRLVPPAVRRDRPDLHPHHQRGARGQPRGAGRDQQAPGTIEWE
ncbi:hypothetical protein Pflav_078800 [Phytohabitans flavus]|uniref:Glutamine amidotransferase n=1 Tax=Phytohabitans flavus TaxID=1076124 RepID=A0A6F8Y5Y1_9ACTN|nr:hypothetical protein Pflav_078800 [Phytohabitans flavus]